MKATQIKFALVSTALLMTLGGMISQVGAITRGANDDDSPEADVVVLVRSQNGSCTGTLISPTAVLTAKHCVTGTDSSRDNKPPAMLPFTVSVGTPLGSPKETANSTSSLSTATSLYYGNSDPVNDNEWGADLAIIWLTKPLFNYVHIVRPALLSPAPHGSNDSEGGVYDNVGVAGWSPISGHDPTQRQGAYYTDELNHYSGYPDDGNPDGQFWVHAQGAGNLEPGDSGGPLFWKQPDGTRQVIGVDGGWFTKSFAVDGFDCTLNRCDIWTDVTRGAIRQWVLDQMEDQSRSRAWLVAHGRGFWWDSNNKFHPDYWKGEVDYTGPCQLRYDSDCDHWYDDHDNCPHDINPAQIEGTICSPPPPPALPPQNCLTQVSCGDVVFAVCDAIGGTSLVLTDSTGTDLALDPYPSVYPRVSWTAPHDWSSGVFRLCARNEDPTTNLHSDNCTALFGLAFPHEECSVSTSSDGLWGGRQCGGAGQKPCRKQNIQ